MTLTYGKAQDEVKAEEDKERDTLAAWRLVSRGMLSQILNNLNGSPLSQASQPTERDDGSLAVSLLVRDTVPSEYIQIVALDNMGAVFLRRTTETGVTLRYDSATTTDEAMKALVRLARS